MDEKVYTPSVIQDSPFPSQDAESLTVTQPSANQTYAPSTIPDQPLVVKRVAHELLSETLNTRTRKIVKQFEFTPSGALQIGDYTNGVNGDIRISPVGVVARNSLGDTTFALDGETGDALFAGELRSGTLITGEIILGDGSIVLDDMGLKSTSNFLKATTSRGTSQGFTTTSYVDLTSSSQTFSLVRSTVILITVTVTMFLVESVGNTGDANVAIDIDGVVNNQGMVVIRSGNDYASTYSLAYPVELASGGHTIKLKAKFDGINAGAPTLTVTEHYMTRIHLGS